MIRVRLIECFAHFTKRYPCIDLANLAIDIPPELLAVGGTITIQKRRVSVTRTADPNHPTSPPAVANTNNTPSNSQGAKPAASSTTPVVAAAPPSSNQPSSQPKTGGSGSSTVRRSITSCWVCTTVSSRLLWRVMKRKHSPWRNFSETKRGIRRSLITMTERKFSTCA